MPFPLLLPPPLFLPFTRLEGEGGGGFSTICGYSFQPVHFFGYVAIDLGKSNDPFELRHTYYEDPMYKTVLIVRDSYVSNKMNCHYEILCR